MEEYQKDKTQLDLTIMGLLQAFLEKYPEMNLSQILHHSEMKSNGTKELVSFCTIFQDNEKRVS